MFDHYMHYQSGDPRTRNRLVMASVASAVTTFSLIVFMWVANKMNVARVDPPTITYIMVQMSMDEPPPPPPPPPPPAGSEEEEPEEEDIPEEEVPMEEEITQPKDTPEEIPDPDKTKGKGAKIPGGVPGGMPGGVPGGVPGGMPGGVPGGIPGGVATKRDTPTQAAAAKKPISAVRANAIYKPDCDAKRLAGTKAATFDKRPGSVAFTFCVNSGGKVVDVKTVKKFRGDPKVDQICRDTIQKWRFKPFMVGGKPQKTCSKITWEIIFE